MENSFEKNRLRIFSKNYLLTYDKILRRELLKNYTLFYPTILFLNACYKM